MEQKKYPPKRRRRPGNRYSKKRGKRPIKRSPLAQYEHLFNIYLQARKKYFEKFDPERPSSSKGFEKNYYEATDKLRFFEKGLTPEDRAKIKPEYKLELTYSENRKISPEGERFVGQPEDPHFLKSQESADFSSDTEESTGSYEDYKKYKGIS